MEKQSEFLIKNSQIKKLLEMQKIENLIILLQENLLLQKNMVLFVIIQNNIIFNIHNL